MSTPIQLYSMLLTVVFCDVGSEVTDVFADEIVEYEGGVLARLEGYALQLLYQQKQQPLLRIRVSID